MELLLLSGGDVNAKETLDLAMEAKNLEALRIMILWDKGGKEQGQKRSLFIPLAEAHPIRM